MNLRQGAAMMTRGYADGSEVFGAIQESEIVAESIPLAEQVIRIARTLARRSIRS